MLCMLHVTSLLLLSPPSFLPSRLLPFSLQPEMMTDSSLPREEANGVTQQEPAALLPAW